MFALKSKLLVEAICLSSQNVHGSGQQDILYHHPYSSALCMLWQAILEVEDAELYPCESKTNLPQVCDGRSGRLVDDAQHVHAGDGPCFRPRFSCKVSACPLTTNRGSSTPRRQFWEDEIRYTNTFRKPCAGTTGLRTSTTDEC